MIKERKPQNVYEVTELIGKITETDKTKDIAAFIKKFAKIDTARAKKIKVALEGLEIIKLRESDIAKILDILPENSIELNKILTEVSLDADETNKILDAIKNTK